MKTTQIILYAFLGLLTACQANLCPETDSGVASTINGPANLFSDRENLEKILAENGVLDPERTLVHFSHTCNLVIQGKQYPVVDVRELVKGAMQPRGFNQIVVLNPGYQMVQTIEYAQERPLFCLGNKLYLYGSLRPSGSSAEGNVLEFSDGGYQMNVLSEDMNELLPRLKR